jgi:hypothetical protein
MLRKRRDEPVARCTGAVATEAQALRDACALACLEHIGNVAVAYEQAPAVLERQPLDDRAVDLWSPLIALALVADAEADGTRTERLLALARELAGLRDAEAESGQTVRLVEALDAIRQEAGEELAPADLLATLRSRPGWDWVKSPRRLASLLNPLGLVRTQRRESGRRRWVYRLEGAQLADLRARYGAVDGPEGEAP